MDSSDQNEYDAVTNTLISNCFSVMYIHQMTREEAVLYGISESERWRYTRLVTESREFLLDAPDTQIIGDR